MSAPVIRPCTCNNARTGDYTPDQCLNCWKWLNSEWWRKRWETGVPPPSDRLRRALPCVHVGDQLTIAEIEAAGINPRLAWHRCELGLQKGEAPAGIVCRCRGCGPTCEGYEPDATAGG